MMTISFPWTELDVLFINVHYELRNSKLTNVQHLQQTRWHFHSDTESLAFAWSRHSQWIHERNNGPTGACRRMRPPRHEPANTNHKNILKKRIASNNCNKNSRSLVCGFSSKLLWLVSCRDSRWPPRLEAVWFGARPTSPSSRSAAIVACSSPKKQTWRYNFKTKHAKAVRLEFCISCELSLLNWRNNR